MYLYICMCQGSVVCVMCSRLLCPYLVCFLSLFHVIMSWVCSSCVCLLCVNYPLYISPVFSVWFRLVYLWLPGVSCLSALSCPALMLLNTIIWVYVLVCACSCSSLVCAPWQNVCVCMCVCTCLCYIVRTKCPQMSPLRSPWREKNSKNSKWCLSESVTMQTCFL